MGIHGVDADQFVKLSNMKFLYEQILKADKILSY